MRIFPWTRPPRDVATDIPAPTGGTPPPPSGGLARTFSALSIPAYRTLWMGMTASTAAMQMGQVAQPWLAYHLSGSAFMLGIVAAARSLPMLLLSPLGGVAADRMDKRKLLVFCQVAQSVTLTLTALLVLTNLIQVWHLIVLGIIEASVFSFKAPTRNAYIPSVVPPDKLPNALAVDATGMNINRMLAPSIAGVLLAWTPAAALFAAAACSMVAVAALWPLPPAKMAATRRGSPFAEMMTGFKYIKGHDTLVFLIAMSFIPVLLGMPFQQFLPVFQKDVLHVGEPQLGFMFAATGVGALVGSLGAAYLSEYPRKGLVQILSGVGFGLSLLGFAFSTSLWVSLGMLTLVGLSSQTYMTINRVFVMMNTDRAYYGRVMSVYIITFSLNPLAVLPMGKLVDVVGAPATIGGAAALLVLAVLAIAVLKPSTWRETTPAAAVRPAH